MADCPGVVHLAEMADGGLARIRVPGGRLTATQARSVAALALQFGSGVIDLTNRANLQMRGLPRDAGPKLAEALLAAGLMVAGEADRRRNVLLDPLSGLDAEERRDLWPLAAALDAGLTAAPWIAGLSPKFAFVLDGGGRSGLAAAPSDVALRATRDGRIAVALAGRPLGLTAPIERAAQAALAIARLAAQAGPDARGRDLDAAAVGSVLRDAGLAGPADAERWPDAVNPSFGAILPESGERAAVVIPVAVGRLTARDLLWLADAAEGYGEGALVLAQWSALVLPGVPRLAAAAVLAESERAGFPPVAVVERLSVVACAGAPACVRAVEPAKAVGLAVLAEAAAHPERLPAQRTSVHVSACPKGCAGSARSDLLLLGSSEASGFTLHERAAPRRPGPTVGRLEQAEPSSVLTRLAATVFEEA